MPYPAALAVHLIAVMLFVGGLFLAALVRPATPAERRRLQRWNLLVTSPALFLVWGAGTIMAVEAGWFAATWLHAKLGCVVLLSLLHLLLTWRLYRTDQAQARWPALLAALLLCAILYLVAAKPL